MTYLSEVLADSPWGFWWNDETSGTNLADSSGNARPMTIAGSPTLAQDHAIPSMSSILWDTTAGECAATAATFGSSAMTIETWVYLPTATTLTSRVALVVPASSFDAISFHGIVLGLEIGDFLVAQTSAGKVTSAAIARDTWYHVVASNGAAGLKIRANKVTVASNPALTTQSATAVTVYQRGSINLTGSGSDYRQMATLFLGPTSVYPTQLSDARADAHYDAAWAEVALSIQAAAVMTEALYDGQEIDVASTRLGVLLLETVPINVGAVQVDVLTEGSEVRVGASHVEVLYLERPGLRTVEEQPVRIRRADGRWEWPWHVHGEAPSP